MEFLEDLQDLSAAEEFLDYFEIDYDQHTVHVNRLHILQRFHDYIAKATMPESEETAKEVYKKLLQTAYQDFVDSNAQAEKVFKVFHMHEPQTGFVPLDSIGINKSGATQ